MTALVLLIDVAAVHRLVRLVTKDTITQPYRERIIRWAYGNRGGRVSMTGPGHRGPSAWQDHVEDDRAKDKRIPRLADLMTCRWCAGIWVAAGVVAARWTVPTIWGPVAYGLALASLATFAAAIEDRG